MATSVNIKLLLDSKGQKVLFAEAGKDFTDFLFTLLSLPIGTVIRLLSTNDMVGTLGKLYQSFENLGDTYIQPNVNKDTLLKPNLPIGYSGTLLSLTNDTQTENKKLYYCANCRNNRSAYCNSSARSEYGSDNPGAKCPICQCLLNKELVYVAPPHDAQVGSSAETEGGFVKGVVTYMIMDDLEVKPMSTISSITVLNKFNIKEVGALEEKTVSVGINEGLKLLKASLETKTVLTNVFMGK
ncbi:hypothetical protein TorRG33x02_123490 [Trema orientale]|uniref:DUF674 domain-containing protein n=1 Tax=Trema orientale TaxID=63057 RepID=A0A2P5F1U0_TREOI|nr:hypothetical protein TorRG33x02_123490 [Trema orientale]